MRSASDASWLALATPDRATGESRSRHVTSPRVQPWGRLGPLGPRRFRRRPRGARAAAQRGRPHGGTSPSPRLPLARGRRARVRRRRPEDAATRAVASRRHRGDATRPLAPRGEPDAPPARSRRAQTLTPFRHRASRSTRSRDASLGWLERERERARRKNVFLRQRKTFASARRADITLKRTSNEPISTHTPAPRHCGQQRPFAVVFHRGEHAEGA